MTALQRKVMECRHQIAAKDERINQLDRGMALLAWRMALLTSEVSKQVLPSPAPLLSLNMLRWPSLSKRVMRS